MEVGYICILGLSTLLGSPEMRGSSCGRSHLSGSKTSSSDQGSPLEVIHCASAVTAHPPTAMVSLVLGFLPHS